VQTNAVLIGSQAERFDFQPSKRLWFIVAMHGLHQEVYDRCTGTRKMLPMALEGARRLLASSHQVEFNCVISELNRQHLDDYISSVPELFSGERRPVVHFSVMGIPEHLEVSSLLVRYTDLLAGIRSALDQARARGVEARVSLSAEHSAVPLCVLLEGGLHDISEYPRMYEHEGKNPAEDIARWWAKGPACAQCTLDRFCLGVPRSYSQRFGFDELRAIG
jgi:hypothetical protein